jgi:hypothetical protein
MARKARAEVEGGLYHVMKRGNNRCRIFNCPSDYTKFLTILAVQKTKLPFFLYAYGSSKNARLVRAKEILIVSGRELGASIKELAEIIGLSTGSVSKRYDTAKIKMCDNGEIRKLVSRVKREYLRTDG